MSEREPLENLGLLATAGYHWRLQGNAIMGVRGNQLEPGPWQRECEIASNSLGIHYTHHQCLGAFIYIAQPIDMPGPFKLFGDKVILWLAKLTEFGYAGQTSITIHRNGKAPQIVMLEQTEVATLAGQQLAQSAHETTDDDYQEVFKEVTERLWEEWWTERMYAMADLASAMLAWGMKLS